MRSISFLKTFHSIIAMSIYKHSYDWFLNSELKSKLLEFANPKQQNTVLEIGCFEGLSSVFLAYYLLDHPDSTLTCVDPFLHIDDNDHKPYLSNAEANFDHNISVCKNTEKITVHKTTSDKFFENPTHLKTYNFIYIDGCHDPDFIKRDMENCFAALEKGGIMWMDDYGGGDGVQIKNAMDGFLEKYAGQHEIIHVEYQLAIRKK